MTVAFPCTLNAKGQGPRAKPFPSFDNKLKALEERSHSQEGQKALGEEAAERRICRHQFGAAAGLW